MKKEIDWKEQKDKLREHTIAFLKSFRDNVLNNLPNPGGLEFMAEDADMSISRMTHVFVGRNTWYFGKINLETLVYDTDLLDNIDIEDLPLVFGLEL